MVVLVVRIDKGDNEMGRTGITSLTYMRVR